MGEGDLEEIEGDAPIGIVKIRRERFEPRPGHALDDHVVDQRGQIAGERVSLRGRRRDQCGLGRIDDERPVGVDLANGAFERLPPGAGEGRERMAPGQRANRGRHGRAGDFYPLGVEDRRRLVRLEGAEGRDARQHEALPAARREQRPGQRLSRALRRHVDRGVGERHRRRPRRETRRSARRPGGRGSVSAETAPRRES